MKILDSPDPLMEKLKRKILQMNRRELLRKMGYHDFEKGNEALEKFLRSPNFYRWLENGHYDFIHNSETLAVKLAEVTGFNKKDVEEAIRSAREEKERIEKLKTPHIYVDTHFVRRNEPIFVLVFTEGFRNIILDKEEFAYLSLEDALALVSEIVREHYLENGGELSVWGKIYTYVYYHTDGSKFYFDPQGNLLEGDVKVYYSRASLMVGNRELIGGNEEVE